MTSVESFSLADSRLSALFLESILYGCYIITFVCTVEVLLCSSGRPKHLREVNVPVLIGTTYLFLVISGNIALSFYRSFQIFASSQPPDRAQLGRNRMPKGLNVVETAFVLFGTIAGDWIVIHRCWILWNRVWKWVAIPFVLWFGCIACATATIVLQMSFEGKSVLNSGVFPYATSFWLASILINVSTTVLTVTRIWLIEKANKESGLQPLQNNELPRSTFHFIICITVETGLLFTLSAVATFTTYVIRSNSFYVISAIELPIVGSACNLMILRGNRRRKRLLKLKLKRTTGDGSDLSRLGALDTVPETARSIERSTELGAVHTATIDSPARVWDHAQANDRIEELPYP